VDLPPGDEIGTRRSETAASGAFRTAVARSDGRLDGDDAEEQKKYIKW
jgi:hypothetical protein